MNSGFETFSTQHFSVLLAFAAITWAAISKGRASGESLKRNIALVLAGVTFASLVIEAVVKLTGGIYNVYTDLPLFLCDVVALMLPLILWFSNRKWIGIVYFWAMAGTLQALITPDPEAGFPSFHFFRYFVTHVGIVTTVLYVIAVWKIRINWKDFLNAILYAQAYIVIVHIINSILGSNYAYTLQKPGVATVLDFFGPWPWYILWGEALMVILFLLLMLPFMGRGVMDRDRAEDV